MIKLATTVGLFTFILVLHVTLTLKPCIWLDSLVLFLLESGDRGVECLEWLQPSHNGHNNKQHQRDSAENALRLWRLQITSPQTKCHTAFHKQAYTVRLWQRVDPPATTTPSPTRPPPLQDTHVQTVIA